MAHESKNKLRIATIVYWILLLYIIAALAWWSISLLQQNAEIHQLKRSQLTTNSQSYTQQLNEINHQEKRNIFKYTGEGATFLLLICIGAFYIYRSVKKQLGLQQQQQNFVMAITHELKTPIAVARLNLQTLQKHQLEEVQQKKLLQTTLHETLRLDTLINNILISSQLEGNAYRLSKEELNFSDLVRDVIKEFKTRYPDRTLQSNVDDEIEIEGDAMLLKLLVSNLLENANKYSDAGKIIGVQLSKTSGQVNMQVTDEGCGIPDEEKKFIFQKFYRLGNEQTRKTQGTGLGLYISKKIVTDHGGSIVVKNNLPAGSKFIIQF